MRTTSLIRNHPARSPAPARPAAVEPLESRRLLTVAATTPFTGINFTTPSTTAQTADLSHFFADPDVPANTVFMQTSLGTIPIQLTPGATPLTVANFLNYVRSGRYENTFFHRSVSNFIIQGGGFGINSTGTIVPVTTDAKVPNEYSASRLNTRGTIAMAKTSDPDSATSQFFFNLGDNTSSLNDTSNSGGFTVFGTVIGNAGLAVMDAIAAQPIVNASSIAPVLSELPLIGFQQGQDSLRLNQLVYVNAVTEGAAYTVTSDNPAAVTASVRGKQLLFTPVANGTAHITVTAKGLDGQPVSQTMTIKVGAATPGGTDNNNDGDGLHLETPPAAAATIGKGAKKSVTFKDKDGTTATITITGPGTAELRFDGKGASVKDNKGAETVTGTNLTLRTIVMIGTTAGSVVTVTTKGGNGSINLGGLIATGAAGTLNGKGVNLVGDTQVAGAITGLSVMSAAASSTISAGSIGSFTASKSSAADVTVADKVTTITVPGTLSGTWHVGKLKLLTAGTIANAVITGGAGVLPLNTIMAKTVRGSEFRSFWNIASFIVSGTMTGSQVYTGVPVDGAVTVEDAVRGHGMINSMKIGAGPRGKAFSDSVIATGIIGSAALGNMPDVASAAPFYGIRAGEIIGLTGYVNGKAFSLKSAFRQQDTDAQLAKAKIALKHVKITTGR